jgi:hypothetical protein
MSVQVLLCKKKMMMIDGLIKGAEKSRKEKHVKANRF